MRLVTKWSLRFICSVLCIISVVHAADIHRIDPSETETFTGHIPCAQVNHDGSNSNSYHVGAKTQAEWQSFYDEVSAYSLPGLSIIGVTGCP